MSKKNDVAVDKAASVTATSPVRVRLLLDCEFGKCNEVVSVDAEVVSGGLKSGILDDSAEAIAYAESLLT